MKRLFPGWRVKLPLLLILFTLVPLAVNNYLSLELMRTSSERATLEAVAGLANAKGNAVDSFTDDRRRDVERLAQLLSPRLAAVLDSEAAVEATPPPANDPAVTPPLPKLEDGQDQLPDPVAAPPAPEPRKDQHPQTNVDKQLEAARTNLRHTLGLILWDQAEFEEILVFDIDGRVMTSTFDPHEGRTAAELDYFQGGLRSTFVQAVFTSPITKRLTMVIATPVHDPNRQVIGVVAARVNLKHFFLMINDLTGLGDTGEVVVGKADGEDVVFMAPTRHDPQAALTRKVTVGAPDARPLQEATRGQDGNAMVTDYRGVCTYAAWRHVPSLEWAVVAKIDCEEAMASVAEAWTRLVYFGLALFVAALLAALLAAQTLVRPLRALTSATERISRGDFDVQIDIRSGDEIGDLADSFERMIAAIKFFRAEARGEKEADEVDFDSTDAASGDEPGESEPMKSGRSVDPPPASE